MNRGAFDPSWDFTRWSSDAFLILTPYVLAVGALIVRATWRLHRRPTLTLEVGDIQDVAALGMVGFQPAMWTYGRLLVSNRPRRDRADAVQVVVLRYWSQRLPDEVTIMRMPLAWTHSAPTDSLAQLHGGSPRLIDLVAAQRGAPWARIQTYPTPAGPPLGFLTPVSPGVPEIWSLEIELVADRLAPRRFRVDVRWDADWLGQTEPGLADGADHLAIENLRSL